MKSKEQNSYCGFASCNGITAQLMLEGISGGHLVQPALLKQGLLLKSRLPRMSPMGTSVVNDTLGSSTQTNWLRGC